MPTTPPAFSPASGVTLNYNDDPTATNYPTKIGGIAEMPNLPDLEAATFKTTRLDALNEDNTPDMGEYMEFGKITPGTFDVTLGCDTTQTQTLYSIVGKKKAMQILLSNGSYLPLIGGIKKLGGALKDGEEVLIKATIQVTQVFAFVKA